MSHDLQRNRFALVNPLTASELYEFGPIAIDAPRHRVTRDGHALALPPKTYELLLILVRSDGRALSRHELISALWPDSFVEDANLTFQISALRKALGEGAEAWIETVPRVGYRFTPTVRTEPAAVDAATGALPPSPPPPADARGQDAGDMSVQSRRFAPAGGGIEPPSPAGGAPARWRGVALATLAAVVAVAGYGFQVSRSGQEPAPDRASANRELDGPREADRPPGAAAPAPTERPAVGPAVRWVSIPGTGVGDAPWPAEFDMGCVPRDAACDPDERPQRRVTLTRRYALTETEITVRQYAEYVRATGGEAPNPPTFPQHEDHPVVGVTWAEAAAFCTWLGGRLPTEAEWEYAARGGRDRIYPWGTNSPLPFGNFAGVEDGFEFTAPVARFVPNRYRLYDMSGNAWEWVADWYGPSYAGLGPTDPTGAESGDRRVLRGDGWTNPSRNGRLSDRGRNTPDTRLTVYGIRCARDEK